MVLELQGEYINIYIYIYSQMFVGFNCFFWGGGKLLLEKQIPPLSRMMGMPLVDFELNCCMACFTGKPV